MGTRHWSQTTTDDQASLQYCGEHIPRLILGDHYVQSYISPITKSHLGEKKSNIYTFCTAAWYIPPASLSLPDCSGLHGVPLPGYVSVCKPPSVDCVQYHLISSVRETTAVLNLNDANNGLSDLKYTVWGSGMETRLQVVSEPDPISPEVWYWD